MKISFISFFNYTLLHLVKSMTCRVPFATAKGTLHEIVTTQPSRSQTLFGNAFRDARQTALRGKVTGIPSRRLGTRGAE
jgi:hypothetical protein